MFTLADIRNIAMQIEKKGEETYRKASLRCANPEVADLLTAMADDEQHHFQWLSTLAGTRELSAEEAEMEQMGRELLQEMMESNPFSPSAGALAKATDLEQVLLRSREFEEDTIVFYCFLLALLDDEESRVQMERIIAEEARHQNALEAMLEQNGELMMTELPD